MSIGQRLEEQDEILSTSLYELYSVLGERDTPRLYDRPFKIDTGFDISFGAGNSLDRKTIYIDQVLFAEIMAGKYAATGLMPQQIMDLWCDHEHTEACIIQGDNAVDTYTPAHKRALRKEHAGLLTILGLDDAENKIKRYEGVIWPGLEAAYKRPVRKAPPDLWCGPLIDDADAESEAILKQLAGLGVADARKRGKYETRYGFGSMACEDCRHWMPQVVVEEAGHLAACRIVSGLVRADRHCDFWQKATASQEMAA